MFSFEAGRRCASGEGYFEFETSFGCQIFQVIQCAIKVALNKASLPTDHEQHHEDLFAVPRQAERSVYLTVSASLQPPLCPQNKMTTKSTIPESEYAIPFKKSGSKPLGYGIWWSSRTFCFCTEEAKKASEA